MYKDIFDTEIENLLVFDLLPAVVWQKSAISWPGRVTLLHTAFGEHLFTACEKNNCSQGLARKLLHAKCHSNFPLSFCSAKCELLVRNVYEDSSRWHVFLFSVQQLFAWLPSCFFSCFLACFLAFYLSCFLACCLGHGALMLAEFVPPSWKNAHTECTFCVPICAQLTVCSLQQAGQPKSGTQVTWSLSFSPWDTLPGLYW